VQSDLDAMMTPLRMPLALNAVTAVMLTRRGVYFHSVLGAQLSPFFSTQVWLPVTND